MFTNRKNRDAAMAGGVLVAIPGQLSLVCYLSQNFSVGNFSWLALCSGLSACCLVIAAKNLYQGKRRDSLVWQISGWLLGSLALGPLLADSPGSALALFVLVCLCLYGSMESSRKLAVESLEARQRAFAGMASILAIALFLLMQILQRRLAGMAIHLASVACLLAGGSGVYWCLGAWRRGVRTLEVWLCGAGGLLSLATFLFPWDQAWLWSSLLGPLSSLTLLRAEKSSILFPRRPWWEELLHHPSRLMVSTFLALCLLGTLLLLLPFATREDLTITPLDAAFTSVSAVCVTGLIVLDTPVDFSPLGQGILLLLIQMGGLGIMTISTFAFHMLGVRLSLRQERALADLGVEERRQLYSSLRLVIWFTGVTEAVGAICLTGGFLHAGDGWRMALWRGLFTSVSAFCNAGFALQSDSLIPYRCNPGILHTVAVLIVLGGLSPAVALAIPKWLHGEAVSMQVRLACVTTTLLLVVGFVAIGLFEWDASLRGETLFVRLNNAWFQSVTLRTAGFNSIDLSSLRPETLIVMHILMFVGGSPGGTAGGIKTTTLAVLFLCAWASLVGNSEVITRNRRIGYETIRKGLVILVVGISVWLFAVIALFLTSSLPAQALLFETTSALGTVGLSLGATPQLDGIGRLIIMIVMFLGRVGPLTVLTVLSVQNARTKVKYPEIVIPMT